MRIVCLGLVFVVLAGCAAVPPSAPDSSRSSSQTSTKPEVPTTLDGTLWKLTVEPIGGGKSYTDRIRFEERHAGSEVQQSRGFASASYSSEMRNGVLTFEVKLPHPEGDSFTISGQANADILWGTMVWRRADWTLKTYRFRSSQQK